MGSIRQFAGQTLVYGVGSILSKLVYYLLVVVLLTYLLGDKTYEFGTYGELYGYLTVLLILFSFKMDTALFRYGNERKNLSQAFNTTGTLVIFSAVFILIIAFTFTSSLAQLIQYPDNPEYILYCALILAFDVASLVPFARLRLENKARIFALLKIFNVFFSSLLILFFFFVYPSYKHQLSWVPDFDTHIEYILLTNVLSSGLIFIILLYYIRDFRLNVSWPLLNKIVPYVLPLVIVGVCNNFIQYNGAAVIRFLSSGDSMLEKLNQSGVFDSSRRVAGLFILFIGAFNYAAEPFFFSNHKESDRKELYGKICHLFVLVGGFIILSLILGMDLVQYLVGEAFRESIFIIPILLIAYLLLGVYHNISIWYKLSDKTIWGAVVSVIGAIVTLVVSFIFIPKMGYVAFAWANLGSYLVMLIISFVLGQLFYKIDYPIFKIVGSIGVIIIIIFISQWVELRYDGIVKYLVFALLLSSYIVYAFLREQAEWKLMLFRSKS